MGGVSAAEALAAEGGAAPLCDCGCGEGMMWQKDPHKPAGGYWRCWARRGHKRRTPTPPQSDPKTCEQCGAEFSRGSRRSDGHPLSPTQWAKMRFCSPACSARGHTGAGGSAWRGDAASYAAVHDRHQKAFVGLPCARADGTCSGQLEVALRRDAPEESLLGALGRDHGLMFSLDPSCYVRLCRLHHRRMDNGAVP